MFRAAYILPRRSLLAAAVAGTAVNQPEPQQKLSIYSSPTSDIILVDCPSELEKQIGKVRRRVQALYSDGHAQVQGWVSRWIGVEHAVENRIKSIVTPDEPLTPGILYVGVTTLSGSIMARSRALPIRFLLPPVFFIASSRHFLPKTTQNLSEYLGSLEDNYFPTLAQKHEIAKAHTAMTWELVKDATKNGKAKLDKLAVKAVHTIQETTGLKIKETLGWEEKRQVVVAGVKSESERTALEQPKPTEDTAKQSEGDGKTV